MRITTAERHKLEENAAYLVAMAALNYLTVGEIEELLADMERKIIALANTRKREAE